MTIEEILAKLGEVNADTNLPMKSTGELDPAYVEQTWPGLISGITNYMLNEDGTRNVPNTKELTAAGFHAFAMDRSPKANVAAGRVRTDKGIILIY